MPPPGASLHLARYTGTSNVGAEIRVVRCRRPLILRARTRAATRLLQLFDSVSGFCTAPQRNQTAS